MVFRPHAWKMHSTSDLGALKAAKIGMHLCDASNVVTSPSRSNSQ